MFSLTLVTDLIAQDTSECAQNLSIFVENAKVKNYEAAYEPWSLVRNECPSINSAIYIYGERILKERLKNSPDNEKVSEKEIYLIYTTIGLNIFLLRKEKITLEIFCQQKRNQ